MAEPKHPELWGSLKFTYDTYILLKYSRIKILVLKCTYLFTRNPSFLCFNTKIEQILSYNTNTNKQHFRGVVMYNLSSQYRSIFCKYHVLCRDTFIKSAFLNYFRFRSFSNLKTIFKVIKHNNFIIYHNAAWTNNLCTL